MGPASSFSSACTSLHAQMRADRYAYAYSQAHMRACVCMRTCARMQARTGQQLWEYAVLSARCRPRHITASAMNGTCHGCAGAFTDDGSMMHRRTAHGRTDAYMLAHTNVRTDACRHTRTHACMHAPVCKHACTHTRTHACTRTSTHAAAEPTTHPAKLLLPAKTA